MARKCAQNGEEKMKMHWSRKATITGHKRLHERSQKIANKDQFIGNWANGRREIKFENF